LLEKLGLWQTYVVWFKFGKVDGGTVTSEAIATVKNNYPYMRLTITIDPKFADTATPYQLRSTVVHEALHEVVYGWMRHHWVEYNFDAKLTHLEEVSVSLLENWIMEHVDA
jgi:hypothetical protein